MTISYSRPNWPFARSARVRILLLAVLAIIAIICLVIWWIYRSEPYAAEAYLRIRYWKTGRTSDRQYDIFRNDQQALMSSGFVINEALKRNDIAQLECVLNHEDPVKWLQDKLEVSFPGDADLMRVALAGGEASMPEYCRLIDAIIESYKQEFLYKEEVRRSEERESKEKAAKSLLVELQEKLGKLETLRAAPDSDQASQKATIRLLEDNIQVLTDVWKELQIELYRADIQEKIEFDRVSVLQQATSSRQ
jgi:hypothetical protein